MPRIAREYSEIRVYHITIRGIDKQNIFFEEKDKYKFLKIVEDLKNKYNYEIYAYCLMDNHVHLVIFDKEQQLSKIMQSIEITYAFYFNKKYDRIGHLFQNRFFNKKVEDRKYMLQLCRYIHQNPQKAGISKTEDYKWSSYKEYISSPRIISDKLLLSIFSEDIESARKEFIKFHEKDVDENKESEIKNIVEYELCEKLTDEEIIENICDLLEIKNVSEILKYNGKTRNEMIGKLKCLQSLSSKSQLARIIGVNRKVIERAFKEENVSPVDKNVQ